ncbi:mitochondrial glycoprotein [Phycomyces blakesleeanus]|uniref:Mitochondrial glyco protein n=2 Tax=Phycomyces blakesleeanus TaxID=4837 RepID=A0A162NI19_PHYB8|nr:hypothetical protein PHYBLDRAFT_78842 [Phycomyces blakesleeanus NRRL 1555(-)]OAD74458.1 hypothetical protein PHYBLDRAFT_78842 [Phycomyces blakesleeanus NRRL 1555(-)]|eukprot:XP_018292498.1 hypothetical protein PHYBLDRAFT_78842 [Phycomyces blakesleeanus NRRL 1555(-)]
MASNILRASLRALSRPAFKSVVTPVLSATSRRVTPAIGFTPIRAFSAGLTRLNSGAVDSDLAHKLDEELQYEKSNEEASQPEFIKEFLDTHLFEIEDKPGQDEVSLTRTFGNEKIRVLFSISDINSTEDPEDFISEELEGAEEVEEPAPSFPVRASVTIEKNGKGAITIDTVAQDGEISIESVMYYKDAKLASDQSSESDWQRRGLYIGPQFAELDEGLQNLFERYLEERGVNAALASFLPDYVEHKEQQEYIRWLQGMKDFVAV